MTAQFPDTFLLDDVEFSLVGINGTGLFNPVQVNVYPIGTCTACWRGYLCSYTLNNDELRLNKLSLSLGHFEGRDFVEKVGPVINGVEAGYRSDKHALFNNVYENLNLKVDFTGGLLIGREFIDELYVHMGFHPAWKYRHVIELVFENGALTEKRDVSEALRKFREKMTKYPLKPGLEIGEESIKSWIESTFSQDYSF